MDAKGYLSRFDKFIVLTPNTLPVFVADSIEMFQELLIEINEIAATIETPKGEDIMRIIHLQNNKYKEVYKELSKRFPDNTALKDSSFIDFLKSLGNTFAMMGSFYDEYVRRLH